jgi:hypothetical protein
MKRFSFSEHPRVSERDSHSHMNQEDDQHDQRKGKVNHMPVIEELTEMLQEGYSPSKN